MTDQPKLTKRIRQQTAVLLSAIKEQVNMLEARALDWEEWRRLLYYRKLLFTTTDQYGTPKTKLKRQGSRLLRAGCPSCGYTIRISNMWAECALPKCPNPDCERKGKTFELDVVPSNTEYAPFEMTQPEQPAPLPEEKRDEDFERMVRQSEDEFFNTGQRGPVAS